MDNDARMIEQLNNALVDLMVKYRGSSLSDRMTMKPSLDELIKDRSDYEKRLLKEGIITTEEDLKEMEDVRAEIDKAAKAEDILKAIARTIAFIATKV